MNQHKKFFFYCFIYFFSLIIVLFVEIRPSNYEFGYILVITLAELSLLQIHLISLIFLLVVPY